MNRFVPFLLLSFLTLLLPAFQPTSYANSSIPQGLTGSLSIIYDYRIWLDRECVAHVRILLQSGNETDIAWVLIPKVSTDFVTNGSVIRIDADLRGRGTTSLYWNVSVLLTPGAQVVLGYSFPNACLVLKGRAVFLSPLLRFPPGARGSVSVTVQWPGASMTDVDATPSRVTRLADGFVVERALPLTSDRLSLTFSVPKEELVEVKNGPLTFVLPDRYRWVAERLSAFYADSEGNLTELFPRTPERVRVTFFLPDRYDEGPEGYVSLDGDGREGSISLNLFLIRMVDGMLEITFMHELVHRYLLANGVSAGATWFHEGLATYLSVTMAGAAGLEAAPDLRAMFNSYGVTASDLKELMVWRPGESRGSRWYAMAYFAFERLFETDRTGVVMALRSLGRSQLATPDDAAKHLFDHLNQEGKRFLIESGLAIKNYDMLSQDVGIDVAVQSNRYSTYANGGEIENATHFNHLLVNALVATMVVVTLAIILIDTRRA